MFFNFPISSKRGCEMRDDSIQFKTCLFKLAVCVELGQLMLRVFNWWVDSNCLVISGGKFYFQLLSLAKK